MAAPVATLLGDVVGSRARSRTGGDRTKTDEGPHSIGGDATTPQPLTVGDEFQGIYPTVGGAIDAALTLRPALPPRWTSASASVGEASPRWTRPGDSGWAGVVGGTGRNPMDGGHPVATGLAHVRTAFRNAAASGADPNPVNAAR